MRQTFLISTAESAPAGIAALVPVGSAPELSHKTNGPQMSCQAGGTYLRGLNAPGNNLPIRHVPTRVDKRTRDHRGRAMKFNNNLIQGGALCAYPWLLSFTLSA
jgi:hypothetical protein